MKTLPQPWSAAMEATMFTGWIYDHLKPHAAALKVAHPLMLRAIAAAKRRTTASMPTRFAIACDAISCRSATWPPPPFASGGARCGTATCWFGQMVQMKNKTSMLLMEAGVSYNKQRLHKAGYFRELLRRTRI